MKEEKRIEKLVSKLGNTVTGLEDFCGEKQPSKLFYPMIRLLSHLVSCEPDEMISNISIRIRRFLHPILLQLLPMFMEYRQVFESKNELLGIDSSDISVELPNEPVIWCSNHAFKDDVAASIGAIRHAYILFGSLPMFFNTFDGIGAYINGVVMCNRKVKVSKVASIEVSKRLLNVGMDMLVFPEGVWNKTPDKLMLNLWPGVYRIAKETGCKIVPVIHYLAEPHKKYKGNVIHTVCTNPISMDGLSEEEGLDLLRDTMATWYYLLMERYGQSSREELLQGFKNADEAWEDYISMHTSCVQYYDKKIELCADFRPKCIVRAEDVWKNVAKIQNVHAGNIAHIQYAQKIVEREKRRDFQRRF